MRDHLRTFARRGLGAVVAAMLVAGLTVVGPVSAAGPTTRVAAGLHPRLVATVPVEGDAGAFAESLAIDRNGVGFTSVTDWTAEGWSAGQVWRIGPTGSLTKFGPRLDVGILSGLAFDGSGRLYAGDVTFDLEGVPSGVLRLDRDGSVHRVVSLPAGTFPNGLAFHGGYLYISDSYSGAIWRVRVSDADQTLTTPWFQSPLLDPAAGGLGVNGIAFKGEALYAVNADMGSVVRIPLRPGGTPGAPTIVATDAALVSADGIAFDANGALWVAVNMATGGALVRVVPNGRVSVVMDDPAWLDYPVQPAFGTTGPTRQTMFVVNGSLNNGTPNVIALNVGVRGARLP